MRETDRKTAGLRPAGHAAWWLFLSSLVLLTLVAAAPLWPPGMVNTRGGGDSPFLLQRTHQMWVNLRAGVFPVRWMPDAAYGMGYPFFSYYAALPYYLGGLLALTGLDLVLALKLTQTLGFVAAGLAMYGWMNAGKRSQWAAWLAAVAYTFAPFHLVNVYVRGDSLSEFYAFVFYPLVLWGLQTLCDPSRPPRRGPFLLTAFAYAGLVLSHNVSALIFSPFALLYLVVLALKQRSGRALSSGLLALCLGLLLSAWFWLPALAEMSVVQTGGMTSGYFQYDRHFRTADLVQQAPLFNYELSSGEPTPFAMGLAQAAFAAAGGVLILIRIGRRRTGIRDGFVAVGFLLSTLMITPLSRPLWDHLPLLARTQFPWRFLSVQALFAAAVTAALVPERSGTVNWRGPLRAGVALLVAAALALSVLLSLHPDRLAVSGTDVTVQRLQLYELFSGNIGSTVQHEYLHRSVVPRPHTSDALVDPSAPPRAIPLDGAAVEATQVEREPLQQVWRVEGEGGRLAFPLLYWPGWSARVDGEAVQVQPAESAGTITVAMPAGAHTVVLRLGRTPVRTLAEVLSLLALLGIAAGLVFPAARGLWRRPVPAATREREQNRQPASRAIAAGVLAICLLVALATSGFAPAATSRGPLTMDFDQVPYLQASPGPVSFQEGLRLTEAALSVEELAPGDALQVTTHWAQVPGDGYTAAIRLVSPAAVRRETGFLAESIQSLSSGLVPFSMTLPDDIARGVYLLALHVWGPGGELRALTSAGRTRGTLYLQPLRVSRGRAEDGAVMAALGPDVWLHEVAIDQPAADRLSVQLGWSAARPMAANYGLSLRLVDAGGEIVSAVDSQPGYGFLPTSLWRPGESVVDRYLLVAPEELSGPHRLALFLYRYPTLEQVGKVEVETFDLPLEGPLALRPSPRRFELPELEHRLQVDFGDQIRLAGYELEQDKSQLRLTLWWQALQAPAADYTVFVHLFDPLDGAPLVQSDAPPCGGAYPTSWWAAGEVVSETVMLSLTDVPDGVYGLAVGLYDATFVRLAAVGASGAAVPDDRLVLPVEVEVGR